ncbi:MAG TPA: mismatch-specific DNA-glycosylase [Rhizomicrobium sp.]
MKTRAPILPDLLTPGLKLVFCGTAPGTMSARYGHYYAHPQNKFWRTLHAVGLTPRLLEPREFSLLPGYGIGLTDIAKHDCGMDKELPTGALGPKAVAELRARILRAAPQILAFTSLNGGRRVMGAKALPGEQPQMIGATRVWILPSPSPVAQWNWNQEIWQALGDAVRVLK